MIKTKVLVILIVSSLVIVNGYAGSATWNLNPTTDQWHDPTNWTPSSVPNGRNDIATFDVSNTIDILIRRNTNLDAIIFNPGASSYMIATNRDLNLGGAGVVNNSGVEQDFVILTEVGKIFRNSASAGADVHYSVRSGAGEITNLSFYDTATAGDAIIDNHSGGLPGATLFFDSSTAGNATITVHGGGSNGGACVFMDSSNAGAATLFCVGANNASVQFRGSSSAALSTLSIDARNIVDLDEQSSADRATIILNGGQENGALGSTMYCRGTSHTSNATLIANSGSNGGQGALIYFDKESRGDRARVLLASGAVLDIYSHIAPGLSLGSIEGKGRVILGANNLTVGENNLDATFSGKLQDGGSITKTGTGVLVLSGANIYTGGTTIASGTLLAGNTVGSATGTGAVLVQAGRLSGDGIIAGVVTVGTGTGLTATISPGRDPFTVGTLTLQSNVTLNSDASYQFNLQSDTGTAATTSANGITINSNALFAALDIGSSILSPGTSFVVIDNTATAPISGNFSNLPDGGTVTIGSNTFQPNYAGGDGNDLTLTVVP